MTSKGRARNPRGQGERLRVALLSAARDLLLELGDQRKLSVRAVTARAGVTPNALYLHFADREELISTVIDAGYGELRSLLADAAGPGGEPLERLRAFALAYLEFAAQRPGLYRVLFMTRLREGVPMPEPDAAPVEDEGVGTFEDLLALVTACRPDAADQFTRSAELWAGLHGYAALRQTMPSFPWPPEDDYVEQLIAVHLREERPNATRL